MLAEDYNIVKETGSRSSSFFSRTIGDKIGEREWTEKLKQTLVDFNIPPPDSPYPHFDDLLFLRPFDIETGDVPACFSTKTCPGDEIWAMKDPYLLPSPFVEPECVILDGFIAGITIPLIILVIVICFFVYKYLLKKQKKRIQRHFAACLTETIDLKATMNMTLSPENLMREFERIDTDSNGIIRKNELWNFISSGKVGEMPKKDFDMLFTILDVDGNGGIDFVEFCQYLCGIGSDMKSIMREMDDATVSSVSKDDKLQRLSIQIAQSNARKSQMITNFDTAQFSADNEGGEEEALIEKKEFFRDDDLSLSLAPIEEKGYETHTKEFDA